MLKQFKTVAAPLLVSLGVFASVANGATAQASAGDELAHIKSSGTILVGTEGTYPPFDYHDSKTHALVGFDVDVMTAVAKQMGVKVQFVQMPWDSLFGGLTAKRFDVLGDEVQITPAREKVYDFSNPYIASHPVLIVNQKNTTIHSFADLKGKTAGESLSSNLHDIAVQYGAKIVPTQGLTQSVILLQQNRIDSTVNDGLSFYYLKNTTPNLGLKVVATYKAAENNGFVVRKGNADLVAAINKALAQIKANGTYLKISEKWFGTDVSK